MRVEMQSLGAVGGFSPDPGVSAWTRRLGGHLQEFHSLAEERDPEMYFEGLLTLGTRLAAEDRLDVAGDIYSFLINPQPNSPLARDFGNAEEIPASIRRRAQANLGAITGNGPSGLRVEFLLRRVAREAMEPTTLVGLTAASAVFRMTRLATLSRLTASPTIGFFTRGFGAQAAAGLLAFSAEATAFPLATRMGSLALGNDLDWRPAQLGHEIASSFIVLGAMRLAGMASSAAYLQTAERFAATTARPGMQSLFHQTGALGGILLGHRLEESVGLRAHQDSATTLIDSLALLAQFHVAGRLAQGAMGERYASWERSLDFYSETLSASEFPLGRRPGPRPGRKFFPPLPTGQAPALAGGPQEIPERPRDTDERPSVQDRIDKSNLVFMSRGKGTDSDGPKRTAPLQTLLRQVSLFRDEKSVRLALSALFIGVTGPLQEEFLKTLEKMEDTTQNRGLLLRDLLADPRLQQTRFLSNDLHARISEQIQELKGGAANRDSGIFLFNISRGLVERSPAEKSAKPGQLTAETLLMLYNLRLHELEKLLDGPESALPFTAKEALAEGLRIARSFARILQGIMKSKDRDFLTQLRNRADLHRIIPKLERRLSKSLEYPETQNVDDWVLMLDIDFFKKVNDTRGHPVGDTVLQEFAETLRDPETIRLRDIIVRYGGEEFFVYLFKAGRSGVEIAAERIRKEIESRVIEIEGEDPVRITASIGAARMQPLPPAKVGGPPIIEGTVKDVIDRADQALLAAKNTGRNRLVIHEDPNIDWTTSILNRAGLELRTPELEAALAGPPSPVRGDPTQHWVLMFDVDTLGIINYAYGDPVGDKVLWNIAQSLRETFSGTPYVSARYGDDEFFVHYKAVDQDEALDIAERIRKGVAQRDIKIEGRHKPIRATISIGAAEMLPLPPLTEGGVPTVAGAVGLAIERASKALQSAKNAGRNRVIAASE